MFPKSQYTNMKKCCTATKSQFQRLTSAQIFRKKENATTMWGEGRQYAGGRVSTPIVLESTYSTSAIT